MVFVYNIILILYLLEKKNFVILKNSSYPATIYIRCSKICVCEMYSAILCVKKQFFSLVKLRPSSF